MTDIGHNSRPVDAFGMAIDDLYDEAKHFLDGEPIATAEQASAVGVLLDRLRTTRKDADERRKVEKKPHDDAAKVVQAEWVPLLEKCDRAAGVCKEALSPWLQAEEARQQAEATAAREAAAQAAKDAQAALAASGDLEARERAEGLLKDAKAADKVAARIERARTQAATEGRAIGLRASFRADLNDPAAALRYYRERQPEALKAWLLQQAQRDVRAGAREIPGFAIIEERKPA